MNDWEDPEAANQTFLLWYDRSPWPISDGCLQHVPLNPSVHSSILCKYLRRSQGPSPKPLCDKVLTCVWPVRLAAPLLPYVVTGVTFTLRDWAGERRLPDIGRPSNMTLAQAADDVESSSMLQMYVESYCIKERPLAVRFAIVVTVLWTWNVWVL